MMYKQFVYFPEYKARGSQVDDGHMFESILHFDGIYVSFEHYLSLRKTDVRLKPEVLKLLMHCFEDFLGFEVDPDFASMKMLLAENFE